MVRVLAINALLLAILLVLTEAMLTWLVARGEPTGIGALDRLARKLYWANVSYVQYEPDCAKHDQELGYTLRPGKCNFSNLGFSSELFVNSAGLRDDETSLEAPEIIVLGDSHAMGWGVNEGLSFADLIELETGKKTLNAGVSSYGTARELQMLSRLDKSNMSTVVLQYSDNDAWENRTFLASGTLNAMSKDHYEALVASNATARNGFGRYLFILVNEIVARFGPVDQADAEVMPLQEMNDPDVLIGILSQWDWGSTPPQLILFEINTGGRGGNFMKVLSESPQLDKLGSKELDLTLLNISSILDPEDYLFPDGHLTPEGHRKVAAAVVNALSPEN